MFRPHKGVSHAQYRYWRAETLEAEHLWEEQPLLNGHDINHPLWMSPDWPPLSTYALIICAYRNRNPDALATIHARLNKIYCHRRD